MTLVLVRRSLVDRRRWLVGWSIGMVGYSVVTVGFWPAIRDQSAQLNDMFDQMPDSVKSLLGMGDGVDPFSPIGYLSTKVYAFSVPLLLLIAGIGVVAAIAGDEEHGLLETVFALPITRRRLLLERWFAALVLVAVPAMASLVATLVCAAAVDLGAPIGGMVWATVGAMVLTWSVTGLTLVVGAFTGQRGLAIGVGSVTAVASYLITSLADARIGFFETIEPLSVFTHYDVLDTLASGRPSWSLLVLVGVAVVATAAALWAIDHRDLRNA
ncbi:MAG: ABC transporter permease subunit [Acidimicrobiales bacterium]